MTETERSAYAEGFEAARKAAIDAISLIAPEGRDQERYQRLAAAAVNGTVLPPHGPAVETKKAAVTNARFAALKERLRPADLAQARELTKAMPLPPADAPAPTHWADRQVGEDG